jgi:hypothetical protein
MGLQEKAMPLSVDHLKKVHLELQTDRLSAPFEFICGSASEGFCPFEYELLDKSAGARLQLSIPRDRAAHLLGHLYAPIRMSLQLNALPPTLELTVAIVSVSDPEPREIVRAMAQAADQSGCGGDCGCGCGGH